MKKVIFTPAEDTVPATALMTSTFIGIVDEKEKYILVRGNTGCTTVTASMNIRDTIDDLSQAAEYDEVYVFEDLKELIDWLCQ